MSTTQNGFFMPYEKGMEIYTNGSATYKGVLYTFIEEKEGEITGDGNPNEYNAGYSREIEWFINDDKENKYSVICFEAGDYKEDMQITNLDFSFDPIK